MSNPPSSTSSDSKAIPLKARRDLLISATADGQRTVKDPVSLQYYRLSHEEFAVFSQLDGRVTFEELSTKFRHACPGADVSKDVLNGFLVELLQAGLVIGPLAGLGRSLVQRSESMRRRSRITAWLNPLSIKVAGPDPATLLTATEPFTKRLLSAPALLAYVAIILIALAMAVLRFDTLVDGLPALGSLFSPSHLLLCGIVFLAIKVLHEFAHATVCRHFGGECHEMGVLLIVFVPLFYCDVTDAWMVSGKWKRIAISSAGIGLELVLAALATVLWWFSVPGVLHDVFLSVMVVCSLNTFLFNGNPLLRYDGYHVLADLSEVPNLYSESRAAGWATFDRLILGEKLPQPRSTKRQLALTTYAIASSLYRVIVIATICWCVMKFAVQHELRLVGYVLIMPLVCSLLVPFAAAVTKNARRTIANGNRKKRSFLGIGAVGLLLAVMLLLPLPFSIASPFVVVPGEATALYAATNGRVEQPVRIGEVVRTGQTVAEISNAKLKQDYHAARTKVGRLAARVAHLGATRSINDAASMQLPIVQDALASAEAQAARISTRYEQQKVCSPSDGTIIAARSTPNEHGDWRIQPGSIDTSAALTGSWVTESLPLCFVGDPEKLDAELLVSDSQIEFLKIGQSVQLYPQSDASKSLNGTITQIASVATNAVPEELVVSGLAMPAHPNAQARWQVHVRINAADRGVLYSCGRAKIVCGRRSLFNRLRQTVQRTFALEL
ncbi:HlyD family efflux transporter periplasmic adaptor subunit [bacterium]|nr:HlyD family efflux transporter periplasmic adaptor subunit [bacterium]